MEGITAFTPPPKQFAKAAEAPVVVAVEDEETEASRGIWIVAGVVLAVLLVLAVGFWIASQFSAAPPRPAAAVARPIVEKSESASTPLSKAAEQGTPPASAASSMQPAASEAKPPPPQSPRTSRVPSAQASKQQPSVYVANPEWKSQVRRIGNVDAETERSTMTVLDAIHQAQERERERPPPTQPRSSAPGGER